MRWIVSGVVLVIALAFVLMLPLLRRSGPAKVLPVNAKPLLSQAEQRLYARLMRAFPGHIILAQVALSQLLVVACRDAAGARSVYNSFSQLVADFVLCAPDFTAVAVIELDDRSHTRPVQRERDQRKDRFLQAAGIKVFRIAVADMPSEAQLRALVAAVPAASSPTHIARRA